MQSFPFFSLFLIPISFFLALMLTSWIKDVLSKRAVLDVPNDRSLHKIPVPRGGGWALLIVLVPSLCTAVFFLDSDYRHVGLVVSVLLLALISWVDDRKHISPPMRLSMHILAVCLGSFSFAPEEMLLGGIVPFWLDRTLLILGWAWFINLYNFMDGIDGITGVETVSICVGLSFVLAAAGIDDPFVSFLLLILTGACLGFLAFNWHPAKIFLGDIGSVPLGYLVGFCLLSLAVKGHLAAALILPLYYLADSSITLVRRILHREKFWLAHREHFYQRAALGVGAHSTVALFVIVANACLIAAAVFSLYQQALGICAAGLIVGVLLGKMQSVSKLSGTKS
ncbi:MAG: glycosyltransferase family 4 protein [Bdellovibrionales bacterium]|jgi:UDP-N-acetylmuramyl pentapeptide phosphotransferase/UDP-N-acetylglucosamine-1-phosphate transferase